MPLGIGCANTILGMLPVIYQLFLYGGNPPSIFKDTSRNPRIMHVGILVRIGHGNGLCLGIYQHGATSRQVILRHPVERDKVIWIYACIPPK